MTERLFRLKKPALFSFTMSLIVPSPVWCLPIRQCAMRWNVTANSFISSCVPVPRSPLPPR